MLQIRGIKKDYVLSSDEVVHALRGITLDFRKNEFVSILGPSGCGKTTLMNIVGGLDKYTEGDLIIDGKSTKGFSDSDWDNYRNKRIGFVFQTYNLIPHLTVLNNVELALTLSGIPVEARKKRAAEALEKVGLHDQLNKKPNQLSGGQMQRVAIARALVNSPDILLADEPTGALDTVTSEQIMELIREIAGDKLVIMVTHNPDLANRYSTRLVRMLDGEILSDSNPFDASETVADESALKSADTLENPQVASELNSVESDLNSAEKTTEGSELNNKNERIKARSRFNRRENKTAMSFWTALTISLKNLFTKKGRTILTSIAGSIGIIGISLILAISNGMNIFIDKFTTDTLSGNPITISETAIDFEQAMSSMSGSTDLEKFPLAHKIFIQKIIEENSLIIKNQITENYIEHLKNNLSSELYNDIIYKTGQEMNIYTVSPESGERIKLTNTRNWQMLARNEFISMQYDLLPGGDYPKGKNDLVLIVDEYNRLTDSTLIDLGILSGVDDRDSYDFTELVGKEYRVVPSSGVYENTGTRFVEKAASEVDFQNAITVNICGILRINPNTEMGVLSTGIGYSKELYNELLGLNADSEIVRYMLDNPDKNPLTGTDYINMSMYTKEEQRNTALRRFGGISIPNEISIYAKDFQTKESIKTVLKSYNEGKTTEEAVIFTDMSEVMGNMMSSMVNVISYVLIGFTAISLIVSCVMIGIITYISVIERTKEIGILRAIGARKKDITRVFNAETFIIGFFAGLIGIIVTEVLTFPINAIIKSLTGVGGIANLNIIHAVIMILISIGLTVISGLLPALKASKKDPVLALRTE